MSTYVETVQTEDIDSNRFSLPALIHALESQNSIPSLEQIYDWLRTAEISAEELSPYIGFKEGNYWRHRVCRNQFVEMLVLCWRPGQRTPIHDHNGSHGGVRIWKGMLWETTFSFDPVTGLKYRSAREYAPAKLLDPISLTFTNWVTPTLVIRTSSRFTSMRHHSVCYILTSPEAPR